MAQFQLAKIVIIDPVDENFAADDIVIVYWDDSTEDFAVTLNGEDFGILTGGDSTLGEQGTNYNHYTGLTSTQDGYGISGYSFCDGTTLNWFRMLLSYPVFPFFEKKTTANSPVCDVGGGAVCDIHFNGPPALVHSPDTTTGGSATVSATSSNGTVKYALADFDYASGGQTSGTFSNLLPGSYTVYAKDTNDCTAVLTFQILFKPTGNEHYRFTWETKQVGEGTSRTERIRIYEREYVGSVVEVDNGSGTPFTLYKPKQGDVNDKFYPIHPTNAVVSLIAKRDYQFLPLFTQDDKRYRVVYEVEGVEKWQGFIIPSVYLEPFIPTPYAVEISLADNLKTLEDQLFLDDSGQLINGSLKLIKVLAICLNKTGLSLKIRSGINIFETNHNTAAATDDPLDQTYIDTACYRRDGEAFSCWEVIEAILKPFGARLYQWENQWIIEEIDRAVTTYAYRVFDADGEYESNSTFDPVMDIDAPEEIDRIAFIGGDHTMEVIPAYGKIDIVSRLNYIGSIVAGGFEKTDLLSPEAEEFDVVQGIFTSEEGFKDWTLRMPSGVSGVSFGRIVVGKRGDSIRTGLKTNNEDLTRSVGAFFYFPDQWAGNPRNAYIESAEKPYQYGPGDEFNFRFEYSTPARPEYPFMILRFVIKLGSNYLQQDLTWGATEHIYRAYPSVSNSLQSFELGVQLPDTDTPVDTTVQVRIYYYAAQFYEYGTPSKTNDPTDGTEGLNDLRDLATVDIDYDYKLDVRQVVLGNDRTYAYRTFRELRIATTDEDLPLGVVHPDDFNSTTNKKIWWPVATLLESESSVQNRRGIDRKFYLDNITLDALINGQPPPEEETVSLEISKFINEDLQLELFHFDVPDIVNAKNMYNNYFRLSDGTPTSAWARSGISESLRLQQILLKVLGSNHSAPTFRMRGSFINEFANIGLNNYIRLTKPGSSMTVSNTEFTTNLTGWTGDADGATFSWSSDNSGSAEVTLTGSGDSEKLSQSVTHNGGYINVDVNVFANPTAGSTREDILWLLFYDGAAIIHTEKLKTFGALTSLTEQTFSYKAFAPGHVTKIGFYFQNVSGSGTCVYQVSKFAPDGTDIQEVYQISDYEKNAFANTYNLELMQISKTYISLSGVDSGGNNQGGGSEGSSFSGAYSSAYGGGFDSVLN